MSAHRRNRAKSSSSDKSAHDTEEKKGIYPSLTELDEDKLQLNPDKLQVNPDNHEEKLKSATKNKSVETTNKDKITSIKNNYTKTTVINKYTFLLTTWEKICIFIVLFIACFIAYYAVFTQVDSVETQGLTEDEIVQSLEKKFTQIPKLSFKIIKASIRKVINFKHSEPTHPSILLLVGAKGTKSVLNSFATELARLTSRNQKDYVAINGNELSLVEPKEALREIDDKIKSACSSKDAVVVLIENLDMVPAAAAKIFYSYFDDKNAPYKRVVFISTISTEETIPESADSVTIDSVASNHLKQAWKILEINKLLPLLSRVTVSVAAVQPDNPVASS